ncbi:ycf20-like protein [Miscanthus floridulus]|uniref:ycf20-like protein n=1 Tax=Miscanthus floridulus TaxID=154761 RepID=UPI00345B3615
MPLRRGAPPCPPRPLAGVLCVGGGSAGVGGRCCAPIRRACFLRPTKEKSGGALWYQLKNCRWRPTFALETGGPSNTDGQDFDEDSGFLGRTRLGRLIQAAARELLDKLNSARTNSPTKIFLVLLGFYTANALATILGQTGDWDVLVAGVVVAAIEGIGMLMYRKPITRPPGRFQSLISMVNYWKAGVCLGLFVDAFKLGS